MEIMNHPRLKHMSIREKIEYFNPSEELKLRVYLMLLEDIKLQLLAQQKDKLKKNKKSLEPWNALFLPEGTELRQVLQIPAD